ncbi:MAG: class I SAM-dependent methyltransferase [Patescibacteria group bacterium]
MLFDFVLIFVIIILTSAAYASLKGAPWVPTVKHDVERAIKLANIKPGEVFYDLGCGDGRLVAAAADRGAKSIGIELSFFQYLIAVIRNLSRPNTKIKCQNLFKTDLSQADVVYFFLMPKHYQHIMQKFKQELKPGARVVAYVWPIKEWTPVKIDKIDKKCALYLYEIKQ